jgi:hypothetical protein
MSRVDKLVAQREREASEARATAEAAAKEAARREREEEWQELVAEIGPAVDSLERRDWPGAQTLKLERRGFFGWKKYSKAGREVYSYGRPWKDTTLTIRVYLLSDGQLAMTSLSATTPIDDETLDLVLSGDGYWGSLPIDAVTERLRAITVET